MKKNKTEGMLSRNQRPWRAMRSGKTFAMKRTLKIKTEVFPDPL